MKDQDPRNFKFKFDDDGPSDYRQTEAQDNRVEKLSHRITLVTILLPLLLLVIFVVAYFDIKSRVDRTQDTGTLDVETLAKTLESKFSALSIQNAKLEENINNLQDSFTKRSLGLDEIIGEFEKTDTSLKEAIRKVYTDLQADIDAIRAAKTDQKDADLAFSAIESRLAALEKGIDQFRAEGKTLDSKVMAMDQAAADLKSLGSELRILDNKITQDLVKLSLTVNNNHNQLEALSRTIGSQKAAMEEVTASSARAVEEIAALKTAVSDLSAGKMDKALMELITKKHQENFNRILDQATEKIEKKIDSLAKRINDLEQASKGSGAEKKPGENSAASKTLPQKTTPKPVVPKPGSITEQDIR